MSKAQFWSRETIYNRVYFRRPKIMLSFRSKLTAALGSLKFLFGNLKCKVKTINFQCYLSKIMTKKT